jgi:hypothetical protein
MKGYRTPSLLSVLALSLVFLQPVAVRAGEFRVFFNHIHTIYSLDNAGWEAFKPSVAQVISRADEVATGMGMEACVPITDHRTIDAYFDPGFAPVGVAQPMKGEEWGGSGHAGALNFTGDTRITEYSGEDRYERMVEETHARGGIVIANHPRPLDWETDRRLGVDGIEVWNTLLWNTNGEQSLAWWHHLLAAGERVTAMGGSDAHFIFTPIDQPLNLVWCESNDPDDMVEGILGGRVLVVASPAAARVFPAADTDGDGVYDDAMTGDVLEIPAATPVDFEIRLEGALPTDTLVLSDRQGEFYSGSVGSGAGWVGDNYYFSYTFSEFEKNFVRAELRNSSHFPQCITNPIYAVGALAPAGTEGVIQGTARRAAGGAALPDVKVTATPGDYSWMLTGSDGSYSILLPNGTYTVTASKTGYLTSTRKDVRVESGTVPLDFTLTATGCGTVPTLPEGGSGAWAFAISFLLPLGLIRLLRVGTKRAAAVGRPG